MHCFPDIPVDEAANVRRCLPTEDNFQRVKYDTTGSNPTKQTLGTDGEDSCSHRKGSISTAQLTERAYQKGFADGIKNGMLEAENTWHTLEEKKLEPVVSSLEEVLLQLNNIRKETYHKIEKELVQLALAIARQVICQEITMDREIVVCVAREALAKVEDPGKIKIKMSPSDLQFINETQSRLSNLVENIDNVTFESTENIQSGGCIVETDIGEIDARIDKQLQAIEESFRIELVKP